MKDIIITVKQQKREIKIWLIALLVAFLLNVCAIWVYDTEWSELWTQGVWVLILSFLIYVLLWVPRLICWTLTLRRHK